MAKRDMLCNRLHAGVAHFINSKRTEDALNFRAQSEDEPSSTGSAKAVCASWRVGQMQDAAFEGRGLTTSVLPDRFSVGRRAASDIATEILRKLSYQPLVRIVFAAAPSQREMLEALRLEHRIDWSRVSAFQMDEYLDLPAEAPQRFAMWLKAVFFDHLPIGRVHFLETDLDPEQRAREYAQLLGAAPIDMVCLGVGINGHIAFNDPPVADFEDKEAVKLVELDEECRRQQVLDKCFASIDEVPRRAVTLTVPRLLDAERLFCVAPGASKREAIRRMLTGPINSACPATALRLHPDCRLYLDRASASLM
jgi:glucosamine-6-phosphate deaminase